MSLSLLLAASDTGGGFQAPTVEDSFFFDKIGSGAVISSVKAMVLLVLGAIIIVAFFTASARKSAVVPSKLQFAGESLYGFVRNGVAIEILGKAGKKWSGFLATLFVFVLVMNLWELIPFAQLPVTSHFAVPAFLAIMVWFIYNIVGIRKARVPRLPETVLCHRGCAVVHAHPADPDRIHLQHHAAAVHHGRPTLCQHVRRAHARRRRCGRHDLPVRAGWLQLRDHACCRSWPACSWLSSSC